MPPGPSAPVGAASRLDPYDIMSHATIVAAEGTKGVVMAGVDAASLVVDLTPVLGQAKLLVTAGVLAVDVVVVKGAWYVYERASR